MKRGQASAAGAATLIGMLTVMIILYVLFLPEADRNALLNDQGGHGGGVVIGPDGVPIEQILLSQTVGRLYPPSPNEVEHNIPSFTIFTSVNAVELKRTVTLHVKKSMFGGEPVMMNFPFDERNTDSVMLSFNVKKTKGYLIVKLNGQELFNSELNSGSPAPIPLPRSMLKPMNEITFEGSSPGIAFWSANGHELVNVIVSGEVTDRSASTADQHFSISAAEYEVMQGAELSFLPNCDNDLAGRLTISANDKEIYSGFADCGVPNRIEVAKELLKSGDNKMHFISDQGQYLVDLVKVTTKMAGGDVPVFYFNLPNHMFERLYYGDGLLFLTVRFTDMRSHKAGVLNLNGFETSFQMADLTYQTQVDPDFLLPGPNSVILIPQGQPLDVAEIRVELR